MNMLKSTVAAALVASTALSTPVSAQTSAPLIVESSSSSSAPGHFLVPYAIALSYGIGLGDFKMKDIATAEVLAGGTNSYWDFLIYWKIAQTAAVLTMLQAGYFDHRGDVDTVTQAGGAVFNTNGSMSTRGVFVGLAVRAYLFGFLAGDSLRARRARTGPEDNQPAITGALSLGYGQQEFSAFGGGFTGQQDDMFLRAELGVEIPLSSRNTGVDISLNPGVVYTQFDGDTISGDNLVGVLRLKFEF